MADTGIFATTAEIQAKAGIFANATYTAEAYTNQFISQAESYINDVTRYNWSDAYSGLNVDVKGILKEAASNIAAVYCLNADFSSFPTLAHYQTHINLLWDRADFCLKLLSEQNVKDFIDEA